jgi:hypothetical protein
LPDFSKQAIFSQNFSPRIFCRALFIFFLPVLSLYFLLLRVGQRTSIIRRVIWWRQLKVIRCSSTHAIRPTPMACGLET